jgi:hypothetical protein
MPQNRSHTQINTLILIGPLPLAVHEENLWKKGGGRGACSDVVSSQSLLSLPLQRAEDSSGLEPFLLQQLLLT